MCNAQYFSKLFDLNQNSNEKSGDGGSSIIITNNGDYFLNAFAVATPLQRYTQASLMIGSGGSNVVNILRIADNTHNFYVGNPGSTKRFKTGFVSPFGFAYRYETSGIAVYNSSGDTIYTKTYSDTSIYNDVGVYLDVAKDSSIYLVGERDSIPYQIAWGYLQHISPTGQLLWMRTYKPTAGFDTTRENRFTSVQALPNGNILVGGMSSKQATRLQGLAQYNFQFNHPWMLLLDSVGNILKDTMYSDHYYPGAYVGGGNVFSDVNGGYFHWGQRDSTPTPYPQSIDYTANYPFYLAHLDTNFRMEWRVSFPSDSTKLYGNIFQVIQTKDSGYLVMGSRRKPENQGWLHKINKNGKTQWEHLYYRDSTQPGYLVDAEERATGGYVAVGWTNGCPTCSQDVWLLSVDSNGCELPGCSNGLAIGHTPPVKPAFALYPNPTSGAFTVNSASAGKLEVYNLQGQIVAQYQIAAQTQPLRLPASLSAGMYYGRFVSVKGDAVAVKINYEP